MTHCSEMNIERARENMVEQQIRPWDVLDPTVLELLRTTPRELFVANEYACLAFADLEIPLAHDQHMLAPKIEGRMLQALTLRPTDRSLLIGTGSGYTTACLARASASVESVERYSDLSEAAADRLKALDIARVRMVVADALGDWQSNGKYDVVALTASVPTPAELIRFEQLLTEGGRLFAVVGRAPSMSATLVVRRGASEFQRKRLFETVLTPLVGLQPTSEFVF